MYTQIIKKQVIKTDIENLWNFMSSPKNLDAITPKEMKFNIKSNNGDQKMYEGMIIAYTVTPVLYIPLNWITEITHIKKHKYFVDEQRIGPYQMWHHEHIFEEKEEGILMTDIITYVPPMGMLGKITNYLFIRKKVYKIFDYRKKIIEQIFNNK
jgi:ligand-binding SRPBCC domain-containing protein